MILSSVASLSMPSRSATYRNERQLLIEIDNKSMQPVWFHRVFFPFVLDIDECLTTPCTQKCNNNAGGYACECDVNGYQLDADLSTCIGA